MQNNKQSVYKIFSRKRIKIFKPIKHQKSLPKFIYVIIIMMIVIFFYTSARKSIDPIFENICEDEAKAIATKITNDESTKALERYNYEDLFTVEKDESRKYTNDKCKYINNRQYNF